jgi:hypothetical protein
MGLALVVCGLSIAAAAVLGPGASPAGAAAQKLTPVVQKVHSPPRWYNGDDGRFHLKYEILLTNAVPLPVTISSIEVRRGNGGRVTTLSGERLEATVSLLGSDTVPTAVLPPSTVGVAWIDLSFRHRNRIPRKINHRLTIDLGPGLPVGPLITSTGARAKVASRQATRIGPPLRGGRWVAIIGAHRRAMQPLNGALHNGQRFAIDFGALLDDGNRTHVGDPDLNTSFFNYGQPVLAVAAAKVVAAVDRYPNQRPPPNKIPVSAAAANGNHVILRLAKGVFAFYAHLGPGSVRVDRGDRVRRGQVVGKLGNSGNSSGPHLHFQLMNRPSSLDSDGLPFVIDRFRLNGRVPSLPDLLEPDLAKPPVPPVPIDPSARGPIRNRGLTDLDVVTFSGSANPR